MHILYC